MRLQLDGNARIIIAGRTGTGKTVLAAWLMQHASSVHWIILDPKHTVGYNKLPRAKVLRNLDFKALERSVQRNRYTIVRPAGAAARAESMDAYIGAIHERFRGVGLCCDELYTLHIGGRAGDGLMSYLTRGRERRQVFLGLMQRPRWVSRFLLSEASQVISLDLALAEDRKALVAATGCEFFYERIRDHQWLLYDVAADRAALCNPVPLGA